MVLRRPSQSLLARARFLPSRAQSRPPWRSPKAECESVRAHRLAKAKWAVYERSVPEELRDRAPMDAKDLQGVVEARIQQSMRDGEFDHLRNKGKPLPGWGSDSSEGRAFEIAMRIMKHNNVKPAWIELMQEVDADTRALRRELRARFISSSHSSSPPWPVSYVSSLDVRIKDLNRRIDTFNLTRPAKLDHIFRLRLNRDHELERAGLVR